MNISIKKQQINTNLIIEADFDGLVETYFGEICETLAKRARVILELTCLQKRDGVQYDKLIELIRQSASVDEARGMLASYYQISEEAANYILSIQISELDNRLDLEELEKQIDKYRTGVRSLLLTLPWKTKSRNR